MKRCVVDASVAVKWVIGEEYEVIALKLLQNADELHAPAHWLAEATNALWAKFAFGRQITADELSAGLSAPSRAPVHSTPLIQLVQSAAVISATLVVTVYDSLYLALAAKLDLPLVTADRRLVAKTRGGAYESRTLWIGDIG